MILYPQSIPGRVLVVLAFAAICFSIAAPRGAAADDAIPFAEYADAFAEAAGVKDLPRNDDALMPALENSSVTVKLGLFDVWFPREVLRDKKTADRVDDAVGALLDLQESWIAWTASGEDLKRSAEDIKTLRKWIKSWKLSKIYRKDPDEQGRPDLLKLLQADEAETAAAKSFEEFMGKSEYLGRKDEPAQSVFLILAPDRLSFLQIGSFIGSLSEENRPACWTKSLATWTTLNCKAIHVIAMEYPATVLGQGDITQGQDMNKDSKTGLLQHVTWNASDLLISQYQWGNLPREMIVGLSMDMVVDRFKEIEVRTGTGSAGKKLAGYEVFVAGGASQGGTLPGRKAKPEESRWRQEKGKDYFVGVLRKVQKDGAKVAAKEKKKDWSRIGCFPILADNGATEYVARAPFFSDAGDSEPVPASCKSDFKEFTFAYQCAFSYWLRTHAENPSAEASPEELAMKYLGSSRKRPPGQDSYAERSVYGMPLSAADESQPSLEWNFLEWLASGKR